MVKDMQGGEGRARCRGTCRVVKDVQVGLGGIIIRQLNVWCLGVSTGV